jgi:dolichol-phosphate mannosyltransferase
LKIVVVTPTYNEAANLPILAGKLFALGFPELSLLVVDDNSPDGTGQVAERLAAENGRVRVLHRAGKQGLGSAYVAGFREALALGADLIVEMDADLSHSPDYLRRMIEAVADCDVVVGSRYTKGGSVEPAWSRWRKVLSAGGNIYARRVTGLKVGDATAGFKCFRRAALERIPLDRLKSDGYAFQIEVAYLCDVLGLCVREIPILFHERTSGKSKMSLRIIAEAMWRVWQIRFRY